MSSQQLAPTRETSAIVVSMKQECTKRSNAKIWIDLDNSPHVPFFAPIIEELEKLGYSILLTARDCFQVCELADMLKLRCRVVGRHFGKSRILKVSGVFVRALQMLPIALRERPDLAISHGSRAQLLCSAFAAIPCITIFDYEFARGPVFIHPNSWAMVPDVIPIAAVTCRTDRIVQYPGIKEDVYVPRFRPDPSLRARLGFDEEDLVVTLRPPANEAHYHNPHSDELFRAVVERLRVDPNIKMVLLPRNHKQADSERKTWPQLFGSKTMVIPDQIVDGLNLIWNSDLVVSGGGTMNREAAALGVPVYSVFRGKIGAVDRYLAQNGRLVLLETVEDVKKIILKRRERCIDFGNHTSAALKSIIDQVVRALDSKPKQQDTDLTTNPVFSENLMRRP
jgi:predicted glycosyltransferase